MTDVLKHVEQRRISGANEWRLRSPTAARLSALALSQASTSISDEALLNQISVGNGEALSALFKRYARLTRSVAFRILRDTAEAEDLVQDLFLYIQRKCGIFDSSKSTARSWIVQMAYHRARDLAPAFF
jgi:RNA polymerase sigma-70 factor (ECF subfamily)